MERRYKFITESLMSMVAGAFVNPADQPWSWWLLLPPQRVFFSGFSGVVPPLSLICYAIGRDCGLVLIRSLSNALANVAFTSSSVPGMVTLSPRTLCWMFPSE